MQLLPAFVGAPERNKVYNLDWLTLVSALPDQSVDAYITDLPYQVTSCSWDTIIPFAPMWEQVKRTLKPRGVFVTTASQPFTSKLVMSNLDWFRYEWIWDKRLPVGHLNVDKRPMMQHESVLVFSAGNENYNPQLRADVSRPFGKIVTPISDVYGEAGNDRNFGVGYPVSFLVYARPNNLSGGGLHPNQKPLALMEYLIKTYTQEGDLIVDFCAGSGTTAVAARNTGRAWIIGDSSEHYCNVARERLRTSILEPHYVKRESDVATMPVAEGYKSHLFAMAAGAE